MGRIAAVVDEPLTLEAFSGQLDALLKVQHPELNPVRACLDLLEPVLKSLEQLLPEPWRYLPKQLPLRNDPYTEMLFELHRIWKEKTGSPLTFTTHGPHHSGRQYELVIAQPVTHEPGFLVAVDHLLHQRLSTRNKRARLFSRLTLLAFLAVERILLVSFFNSTEQVEFEERAQQEYFEFIVETGKSGHHYAKRPLTEKELKALYNTDYENGPMEYLQALESDFHLYGHGGALPYFKQLLLRYRKRISGGWDKRPEKVDNLVRLLKTTYDQLVPLASSHYERSTLEVAYHAIGLYDYWPERHQVYAYPTLHAYMQTPALDDYQHHVFEYYSFNFSLSDSVGRIIGESADQELMTLSMDEPMRIIYAEPDGTLPLTVDGKVLEQPSFMLPKDFCESLTTAMQQFVLLEEKWAERLNLKPNVPFDFTSWWPINTLPMRRKIGRWRHESTRPPTPPARLLDILGTDENDPNPLLELL